MHDLSAVLYRAFLVAVFGVPLVSGVALGHAKWIYPAPRTQDDNIKLGPCQNQPEGNNPTVFTAGAVVSVSYNESIAHPGHYEISFSPVPAPSSQNDFSFLALSDGGLANAIPNEDGMQAVANASIVLPNTPCDHCVLQLRQYMSNTMTYYFSCADVRLVASDGGSDGGGQSIPDAGTSPDIDAGGPPEESESSEAPEIPANLPSVVGGCSTSGSGLALLGWAILGALLRRRRTQS